MKYLESITFDMTAFITDFSFLENVPHVKKLVFVAVTPIKWNFIEELSSLQILSIRCCYTVPEVLNLMNNKNLEYFEIDGSNLVKYPLLKNIPISLQYLNLSYNNISVIPEDMKNKQFITILYGNKILKYTDITNITFEKPELILPKQFLITNVSH